MSATLPPNPPGDGLAQYRSGVFAVTGGADGIGLALAEQAADVGMRVALLDVRMDAVQEAIDQLRGQGASAVGYQCDVTDPASLVSTASRMESAGDMPAILWINAGVGTVGGFLGASGPDIEWVYAVNVLGPIHTARAFVPSMLDRGGPCHVGVTASSASIVAAEHVYGASKHAVLAIGEALRAELGVRGVGVTLLLPGRARTRIWDATRSRPDRFGGPAHLPEDFGRPWREGLIPAEIAAAAFSKVASGGGYCVVLPTLESERVDQFEARHEVIRVAFQIAGQSTG